MLRIVKDEDPVKGLVDAYLRARELDSEDVDTLRDALRRARAGRPQACRVYDLKRRLARALERFRDVRGVSGTGDRPKVVPLPNRKIVRIFPGSAPRTA